MLTFVQVVYCSASTDTLTVVHLVYSTLDTTTYELSVSK